MFDEVVLPTNGLSVDADKEAFVAPAAEVALANDVLCADGISVDADSIVFVAAAAEAAFTNDVDADVDVSVADDEVSASLVDVLVAPAAAFFLAAFFSLRSCRFL